MNSGLVLIIDDDVAMAEAVQDMLQAAGHSTAVACTGFHGLKLAREVKPSVIVCDMQMPNMTGTDVFHALASDPATAHIPRVLMTGYIDADRSCANAFLLKPFEPHQIVEMMKRVISTSSKASTPKKRELVADAHWRG
ncbi:MAG TPA: response regulator [Candidatus Limnocylindria bacterium]|nr:response regulator [Candidatus Limnocylindria bacterium]